MTVLSDDEIVAVVARGGKHWPSPLPTVALNAEEMLRSALRGVRSLVNRDAATMHGIDYEVDQAIDALIRRVMNASGSSVAYVAESTQPGRMRGSAGYLYSDADGAVLDLVSVEGLHNFTDVSPDEGLPFLIALAHNVFRTGIAASSDSEPALFLRSSVKDGYAIRISEGQLSAGTVVGTGADATFLAEHSGSWNELELRDLIKRRS
jgi:hypothetical protein